MSQTLPNSQPLAGSSLLSDSQRLSDPQMRSDSPGGAKPQPISNPPFQTPKRHGGTRGADLPRLSSNLQGRFGRMFRGLPVCECDPQDLERLAVGFKTEAGAFVAGITSPPELLRETEDEDSPPLRDRRGFLIPSPTPETAVPPDDEENFGIAAGYTYFGQFIDHDLTFDPTSFLQKQNDPEGLVDFRTPRFDLDCLYGRGPDDQPYMFADDELHMNLGKPLRFGDAGAADLPRYAPQKDGAQRALIGDKRNDENVIVSQLQVGFIRFHNRVADLITAHHAAKGQSAPGFGEVARIVRWHYQWCVLHDFLPTIVGKEMLHKVLPHLKNGTGNIYEQKPELHFYKFEEDPFIPIEFTTAAYRFGHSMVRPVYRLNTHLGTDFGTKEDSAETKRIQKLIDEKQMAPGSLGRQFIFAAVAGAGLNGFNAFPETFAVDWKLFFGKMDPKHQGPSRVQPAYKFDTSMVNPLGFLPEFSLPGEGGDLATDTDGNPQPRAGAVANLALRNLQRGQSMGLPSGQSVARAMGIRPLDDEELRVGKANFGGLSENLSITAYGDSFKHNAPLWFYILAEALHNWTREAKTKGSNEDAVNALPVRLGAVGGRIIAETFVGLLLGDRNSFLRQDPNWKPWDEFLDSKTHHFGIFELLMAGQKISQPTS